MLKKKGQINFKIKQDYKALQGLRVCVCVAECAGRGIVSPLSKSGGLDADVHESWEEVF